MRNLINNRCQRKLATTGSDGFVSATILADRPPGPHRSDFPVGENGIRVGGIHHLMKPLASLE